MKAATIAILLCAVLIGSGVSVRANDNPNQAAARAALEKKLYQLNHPAASPSPATNSAAAATNTAAAVTHNIGTAGAKASTSLTAPASTPSPGAAFAPNVPADHASAQAAALAALEKKMAQLNHPSAALPPGVQASDARSTLGGEVLQGTSTPATPVTEMPAAETPAARVPVTAPTAVVPGSVAPAAVIPAPKIPAATAAAAVAPAGSHRVLSFPFSAPGRARPANKLVTTTGATYNNVEVEQVSADGIVISYTPGHGGWARTKVPFRDLPPEIRRQYEKRQGPDGARP